MSIDFISPPVEIYPEPEVDWPTFWNTREKSHYLEIGLDRLKVKYTGKGLHPYDVGVSNIIITCSSLLKIFPKQVFPHPTVEQHNFA